MLSLPDQTRATVRRYRMFRGGETVGVAVSSGADSVCLLHVLHQLAPEFGITLCVLHLNHLLRGAESDEDARFVSQLAASLGLPAIVETADIRAAGDNLEQAGRDARRAMFARLRSEGRIHVTATGHTRSDQAETVLYRLLRGSGTAGLSGILPVTEEGVVRPLLDCSRPEIEAWLREHDLSWREDQTNVEIGFVRNRVRHRVLPFLAQEVSPAVSDILAATSSIARDEEDYWTAETARLAETTLEQKNGAILIRVDRIMCLHPAASRRLLRHAIARVKGDLRQIDISHIERILALAAQQEGSGRLQIPGADIFRSFEWLRIGPLRTDSRWDRNYCQPVRLTPENGSATIPLPEGSAICLEIRDASLMRCSGAYNKDVHELDWERLSGALELRNWYPGDQIQLPGRARQKIKSLFQESRIPIWDRQGWPVLTDRGEIVWARDFGPADAYQLRDNTRYVLRVYEIRDCSRIP